MPLPLLQDFQHCMCSQLSPNIRSASPWLLYLGDPSGELDWAPPIGQTFHRQGWEAMRVHLPTPLPRSRDDSTISHHLDDTSVTPGTTCVCFLAGASWAHLGYSVPPLGSHASVAPHGDTHIKQSVVRPPLETWPCLIPDSRQVCALPEGFHRVVPLCSHILVLVSMKMASTPLSPGLP